MSTVVPADDHAIRTAVERLSTGRLVAFPTETVYGLGASTFDAGAVGRVYAMKGRPSDNPLIAHVAADDAGALDRLTGAWTDDAIRLAENFWPGPLTIVLPRGDDVPAIGTGGRDSIAVRCPAHPVAQALLATFGGPVSAPSANRSGHVSPTRAEHVGEEFPNADLLILDGGPSSVGIESTVLRFEADGAARVLRPGSVTAEAIAEVLGRRVISEVVDAQAESPGTRSRHYAPRGPVELIDAGELEQVLDVTAGERAIVLTFDADDIPDPHRAIEMPTDPDGYATALYAAVRRADVLVAADGATSYILIVEPPSGDAAWDAVHDRLRRMVAAEA